MRSEIFSIILLLSLLFLCYGGCTGMGAGGVDPAIPPTTGNGLSGDYTMPIRGGGSFDLTPITIKAAPNTVKIKRDTDVTAFAEKVNIRAARNEHEPFQVIPIPTASVLSDVQVGVSDLYSTEDDFFAKESFSYFLEGYVYCSTPSDSGGDTGWFPDPLIPITNTFDIIKSTGNQPIWINCYIPPGTPPGVYSGNVVVTSDGEIAGSIPIKLRVLDLTLGDTFQLKTAFGLNRECVNSYHGYPEGTYGPEVEAARTKYTNLLLDRGISFWGFDWFKPSIEVNVDNTVDVDFSRVEAKFDEYLGGEYDMTAFQFPLRTWDLLEGPIAMGTTLGSPVWRKRVKSYIQGCADYMDSRGVLDKSYMFVIDEPGSVADYNNIRYLGDLLHELNPRPKFMVTEQAYSSNYTGWGSLLGYVDIFCPAIQLIEPNGNVDPDDPYNTGQYDYETWFYTNTNVWPFPGYAIDHSSLEPRLIAWLCYQHDITGILSWSANYWKMANPWEDPYTLGDPAYGTGNGCLLYPGMYINQYTGQQDIDGPISSIRLEEIREGLEDYEYLMAIGGGSEIPELEMIISNYDEFMTNGHLFYKLRNIGTNYFFGGG